MHIFSEGCKEYYDRCDPYMDKCCAGLLCQKDGDDKGFCKYPSMYLRFLLMIYAFCLKYFIILNIIYIIIIINISVLGCSEDGTCPEGKHCCHYEDQCKPLSGK